MIRFVPTSSAEVAESLSRAMWHLSRPQEVAASEGTVRLFPWLQDVNGAAWLQVRTDYKIAVHDEAVLNGIEDVLAGAGIAKADIDALAALVISKRGGTMTPWGYFPQLFKDLSQTREQLVAAGILEEPNFEP